MTSPDDSTPTTPREPRPSGAPESPAAGTTGGLDAPTSPETSRSRETSREGGQKAPGGRDATSGRTGTAPREQVSDVPTSGKRTAGVWIALVLGAIVLILLLVFILQNNHAANFHYFTADFSLPLGVAMLLAAIAGALVMALVGSVRMFQQSRTIKKLRKQQGKIQSMLDR
ncbi:LapA family protein [Brachybacterium subflavum]|uniref:LapA family protein n=1 Tax=Brachybacterium subflavum TaxID=2585206 RepID=UPI0012662FFB|nr:lipopolysaccharide assembly protein LapA domain-containing protein [Brachybacterium subflavum]